MKEIIGKKNGIYYPLPLLVLHSILHPLSHTLTLTLPTVDLCEARENIELPSHAPKWQISTSGKHDTRLQRQHLAHRHHNHNHRPLSTARHTNVAGVSRFHKSHESRWWLSFRGIGDALRVAEGELQLARAIHILLRQGLKHERQAKACGGGYRPIYQATLSCGGDASLMCSLRQSRFGSTAFLARFSELRSSSTRRRDGVHKSARTTATHISHKGRQNTRHGNTERGRQAARYVSSSQPYLVRVRVSATTDETSSATITSITSITSRLLLLPAPSPSCLPVVAAVAVTQTRERDLEV